MYHQHASVGLRPKQYTKVVPSCPVCRKLRQARKRVAITTYTNSDKKPRISTYKSVEVCVGHTKAKLQQWAISINAKLGIQLDSRYTVAQEVNDG